VTTAPATTKAVARILGRRVEQLTAAIQDAITALETYPVDPQAVIDGLREALCPPQPSTPSNPNPTSSKPNPST
jgi:hypothetical protein